MHNMHKPSFRQRPIDNAKPLQLIKDINEVMKTADQTEQNELARIEVEIKKTIELYGKTGPIVIPNAEKIINNNNNHNHNNTNTAVIANNNNNINLNVADKDKHIKPVQASTITTTNASTTSNNSTATNSTSPSPNGTTVYAVNSNSNSSNNNITNSNNNVSAIQKAITHNQTLNKFDVPINYHQREFVRPEHYIIYSEKNRKENHKRDYEATKHDVNFLNFERNFMSLEQLEILISALENDIGSGDQIPEERVKEIIKNLYSDLDTQHVNKLTKFFFTRREDNKKSLLRKYWRDQKSTDKNIPYTFRKREREKIKTRRNKLNEFESLEKLKEIQDITKSKLLKILNGMKQLEELKYHLLQVNYYSFEYEIRIAKGEQIPKELEDKWKTKQLEINSMQLLSDEKEKSTKRPSSDTAEPKSKPIPIESPSSFDEGTNDVKEENRKKKKITIPTTYPQNKKELLKVNEKKQKPIAIEKSFDFKHKEQFVKEEEPDNVLKLRFGFNRAGKLAIDKYIQKKKSFDPFDDDFMKTFSLFKCYNEDFTYSYEQQGCFGNLYERYLKMNMKEYNLFSDSEEDEMMFQNQIKNFQSSYKQFLKQKTKRS